MSFENADYKKFNEAKFLLQKHNKWTLVDDNDFLFFKAEIPSSTTLLATKELVTKDEETIVFVVTHKQAYHIMKEHPSITFKYTIEKSKKKPENYNPFANVKPI